MNKLKLVLTSLFAAAFMLVPAAAFAVEPSTGQNALCAGISGSANISGGDCSTTTGTAADSVQSIIKKILDIFSWVVGVVSVLMIIFGGFKYITSGGDAGGVTGAKNTILYAIVGLVIVALAQVIVKFVVGTVVN